MKQRVGPRQSWPGKAGGAHLEVYYDGGSVHRWLTWTLLNSRPLNKTRGVLGGFEHGRATEVGGFLQTVSDCR